MRSVLFSFFLVLLPTFIYSQILNFDEYAGTHPYMLELIEQAELIELEPGDSFDFSLTVATTFWYRLSSLDDIPSFIKLVSTGESEFFAGVTKYYTMTVDSTASPGTWAATAWLNSHSSSDALVDQDLKHFFVKIGDVEPDLPQFETDFSPDGNVFYEAEEIVKSINVISGGYDYHDALFIDWGNGMQMNRLGNSGEHQIETFYMYDAGEYSLEVTVLGPGGFVSEFYPLTIAVPPDGTSRGRNPGGMKFMQDGFLYGKSGPRLQGTMPTRGGKIRKSIYLDRNFNDALVDFYLPDDENLLIVQRTKGVFYYQLTPDYSEVIDGYDYQSYDSEILWETEADLYDGSTLYNGRFVQNSEDVLFFNARGNIYTIDFQSGAFQNISQIPVGNIALDIHDNFIGLSGGSLVKLSSGGAVIWQTDNLGISSGPVIGVDGSVYGGTDEAEFYCFSSDGDILWKQDLEYRPTNQNKEVTDAVIDSRGNIYVGIGQFAYLYSFDPQGNLRWQVEVDCRHSPIIGDDGIVYAPGWYGVTAVTNQGELLWEWPKVKDPMGEHTFEKLFLHDNIIIGETSTFLSSAINCSSTDIQTSPWPAYGANNFRTWRLELPLSEYVNPVFSAETLSGVAPLEVEFTNSSSGDFQSTEWRFGDGAVSDHQNPIHTFETPGSYPITASLHTAAGATYRTISIDVYDSTRAEFRAQSTEGTAPFTTRFFPEGSTGRIESYFWDFGDSTTSEVKNANHTYQKPGVYDVMLRVSGVDGADSLIKSGYITVGYKKPQAGFEADVTEGIDTLCVQFTDLSANDITSWQWDFGDGSQSSEENPVHCYTAPGEYSVKLVVEGPGGVDSLQIENYIVVTTAVGLDGSTTVDDYSLVQNYPNPFNPATEIQFAVPEESRITIKVYSLTGQTVATLFSGFRGQGMYTAAWNAADHPSGIYIIRMQAESLNGTESYTHTVKAVLLK